MNLLNHISLRWLVAAIVIACLLPVIILFSQEHSSHEKSSLHQEQQIRALNILSVFASALHTIPIDSADTPFKGLLNKASDYQELERLTLFDRNGKVLVTSRPGENHLINIPAQWSLDSEPQIKFTSEFQLSVLSPTAVQHDEGGVHKPGWLQLKLKFPNLEEHANNSMMTQVLVGGGSLLVALIIIWSLLDLLVTRPIRRISNHFDLEIDSENHQQSSSHTPSEICTLIQQFNRMRHDLDKHLFMEHTMQSLQALLNESNRAVVHSKNDLVLLNDICAILTKYGFELSWAGMFDSYGNLNISARSELADLWFEGSIGEYRKSVDPLVEAIRRGKELILDIEDNTTTGSYQKDVSSFGFKSGLAFPLFEEGSLIGGLAIMSKSPLLLNVQVVNLLRELASDITFGIILKKSSQQRQTTDKKLQEERALLRALLDSIPDPIYFKSPAHVYLGCNRAFEQLNGHKERVLLGATDADFYTNEKAQSVRVEEERVMLGGTACRSEQWVEYPDGRSILLDTLKTPFHSREDKLLGLIGIARDITVLHQQTEQQLHLQKQLQQTQKMEAVGHLTGGIAHDFNNILASILGFADLSLSSLEIPRAKLNTYLERIQLAAQRGSDLVNQLLTFSRGGSTNESIPMDISPQIKETLKLLRATIPSTIEINLEIEPNLPRIKMDPVHLNQLIMNLGINARDALDTRGEITIQLRQQSQLQGICSACHHDFFDDWVELSVTDTGHGISKVHQLKIFEPLFTTKKEGEGTGMGLSIVHGILNSYGAHILVESSPGNGTCFRLLFPLYHETVDKTATTPKATNPVQHKSLQSRRVIVVDDEAQIVEYLEELLVQQGLQVETFTDSEKALRILQDAPDKFDLLITDYTMPRMTGLELVQNIHKENPELPVIICSGYNVNINEKNAAEFGVDQYLDKPVNPNVLLSTIAKLITHD